jgi:competence protein ComEA
MKNWRVFDQILLLSKSERNGALLLLLIIGLLLLIRLLLPVILASDKSKKYEFSYLINQIEEAEDTLLQQPVIGKETKSIMPRSDNNVYKHEDRVKIHHALFKFDPNQMSYEELLKLGFSKASARNLINYRSKGGVFRTREDVKKIYGVDSSFYASIASFILLSKEEREDLKIEINEADSSTFTKLKGIGPVFASRICKYRNQLGGFISIAQLKEVYQFPIETFNKIICYLTIDSTKVKKINVNFAGIDEMKKHPYCKYENARKIIDYRSTNGFIKSLELLVRDNIVDSTTFKRLCPYLKIE